MPSSNLFVDFNNNLAVDDLLIQKHGMAAALLGGVKLSQHWMAFFDVSKSENRIG